MFCHITFQRTLNYNHVNKCTTPLIHNLIPNNIVICTLKDLHTENASIPEIQIYQQLGSIWFSSMLWTVLRCNTMANARYQHDLFYTLEHIKCLHLLSIICIISFHILLLLCFQHMYTEYSRFTMIYICSFHTEKRINTYMLNHSFLLNQKP